MVKEISLFAAFLGGMLWFFSPCIFPLIPSYIAQILGVSWEKIDKNILAYRYIFLIRGSFFILGFSLIFILLGIGASAAGLFLRSKMLFLQKVGGVFIVIFGLSIIFQKFIQLKFLGKRILFNNSTSPFLLGISLSTGITLCTTPILASILVLAGLQVSFTQGITLLIFFSFGLAVPFLFVALIMGRLITFFKRISRYLFYVQAASGIILILFGILTYSGYLSTFIAQVIK